MRSQQTLCGKLGTGSLVLTSLFLCLVFASQCQAAVANFDNLTTTNTDSLGAHFGTVPSTYDGLQWSGLAFLADADYGSPTTPSSTVYGNTYTSPSLPNLAYSGGTSIISAPAGGLFVFDGAYFSTFAYKDTFTYPSGWTGEPCQTLQLTGFFKGGGSASFTVNLSDTSFDSVTPPDGWGPLASLWIQPAVSSGNWWTMDDFTFGGTEVPEPISMTFFVTGLIAVGGFAVRRRIKGK